MQRLLQPLGGVFCKPAPSAFTTPFHFQSKDQLQTRLSSNHFFPASTYYRFIHVRDQLSVFSAGAVQFFVISFPLSHMKTKVQRIWVLSSVSCLTSSSPGYTVIILSVPCGLSAAVERVLQDLLGAGASEQRRVCISTGAALTFHPEMESKCTNPFLQ